MNIGFEAKRFFTNSTGLGNYSRFIVSALSQYFPENNYVLYTPTDRIFSEAEPILQRKNIQVVRPSLNYKRFKAQSIWRTWGIAHEPSASALNIFHGLSQELPVGLPANLKKVVTIHDLIFLRYPKFYNAIDVQIYKTKIKFACKSADSIIAISEQTASDIIHFLKVDPAKIKIVYQGAHPSFKRVTTADDRKLVQKKYGLPDTYILNVGTIEERKNVLSLVKAFKNLPESKRIPLVIAGRQTSYTKIVKDFVTAHKLERWVIFLHGALFADFPSLYQGARLFVYPSLFEGFGIPVIESIESKVPVITSKGSCFSEAGGPSSCYVDPNNVEEFSNAILEVLENDAMREKMITNSYSYIAKFQPPVIGENLFNLYKSL
jgi:glycosyltransferase involved in cell wall biosynthesis